MNSDTDFGDTGRTENFDDPWVNYGGYGYLPNDHRHQLKVRGTYALGEDWELGGTLERAVGPADQRASASATRSTAPTTTATSSVSANCDSERAVGACVRLRAAAATGRTPWIFDLGATVTYKHSFAAADLRVKFSVFNLLNQQRDIDVDDEFESGIGDPNPDWLRGTSFSSRRATGSSPSSINY